MANFGLRQNQTRLSSRYAAKVRARIGISAMAQNKTAKKAIPARLKPSQLKALERTIPDKHHRESFLRLIGQLDADVAAMTLLKGHLVLEEKITASIEKFVFDAEALENARLSFSQKVSIARSISLDESKNSIWNLVAAINRVRNTLAHSLDGTSRRDAMNALRSAYSKERGGGLEEWEKDNEALLILSAVAYCLGFLDAHEQEVERFRDWVNLLDKVANPHRLRSKAKQNTLASRNAKAPKKQKVVLGDTAQASRTPKS